MSARGRHPAVPTILRTVEDFRPIWPGTALEANKLELVELGDDHAVMRMPVSDATRQPMGLLHGGMTMMLAETVASLHACRGVDLSLSQPVGIEINGSHVRACEGGHVRAVARVVRRTQSLIVHTVEAFHEESGELLSSCRVTNFYRKAKPAR